MHVVAVVENREEQINNIQHSFFTKYFMVSEH